LTIATDKGKGVLGEADLNLSLYSENEFKILKLPLKGCSDSDAYIEVGIKGTSAVDKHASERPHRSSISGKEAAHVSTPTNSAS
jgi:hypothetical protein